MTHPTFRAVLALAVLFAADAEAGRITVTATRAETLYAQSTTTDCSALSQLADDALPLHVVRLRAEPPAGVDPATVRWQWSAPSPAVGVFAADLDLGPDDQTRLIRSLCTELGNACVLCGEQLALYDRPTILWIAPTCDVLPDSTTRPHAGDRVRFAVQAFQGTRRAGKGRVTVGYGRIASVTMLVSDSPFADDRRLAAFRDGIGKPEGERIYISPTFGARVEASGITLPAATRFTFDSGDAASVSDEPPCREIPDRGLDACADPPLYTTGGKHLASVQVDLEDGSALCDRLTVNVRTAELTLDLDVTTTPRRTVFTPGDPASGSPLLRVRARNTSAPGSGFILLRGNVLTCDTEAKVNGTTLTRSTRIDLQHCSSTVAQACTTNADCAPARCPTCQENEVCLTSDHCSGRRSYVLGCTSDRDCEAPRCPADLCEPGETCVKVIPLPAIEIGPGDAADLIEANVRIANILTTPARIRETWTVHSFNAGDATDTLRYRIRPRPDVTP